jgi:hypothetical protein
MSPRRRQTKTAYMEQSFTRMDAFGRCPRGCKAEHIDGRRVESLFRDFGGVVHEAIAEVNRKIAAAPKGQIDASDIEKAKRRLAGWGRFAWYQTACDWLTNYAARMHESISAGEYTIESVERPFEVDVTLSDGEVIRQRGRMDLTLRNGDNEPVFREFKTWGAIPTEEDLEDDLQGSTYNASYRREHNYTGVAWREWHSVFHDAIIGPVKADVVNADDAERFIVVMAERMRDEKEWPARINKWCRSCPDLATCEEVQRLMKAGGIEDVTMPTLAEYVALGAKAKLCTDLHKQVREVLCARLDEAGGELREGGLRASYQHVAGGKPISYISKGYTKLNVKPATLEERTEAERVTR